MWMGSDRLIPIGGKKGGGIVKLTRGGYAVIHPQPALRVLFDRSYLSVE
jgi:hypothetical protein